MENRYRKMVETRRLYYFEEKYPLGKYATKRRPLKFLRRLATRIWNEHGRKRNGCPEIRLIKSVISKKGGESYYYAHSIGFSLIELSVKHRTVLFLVHELTHSLGFMSHGRAFVRKYFKLLAKYAHFPLEELELAAGLLYKVKV